MNEECLLVHNAFILQLQDIVSEAAAIRENKKEKNDGWHLKQIPSASTNTILCNGSLNQNLQ